MLPDSVWQTAALGIILILAPTCLAAPVSTSPDFMDPWWFNSCDHNAFPTRHQPKRHNCTDGTSKVVPDAVKHLVKRQMRNFNNFFKTEYKKIETMYDKAKNFDKHKDSKLSWLPTAPHGMKPTQQKVLSEFHEGMQKYAVAIYYLGTLTINTDVNFKREERTAILRRISWQMKSLLCEIETAVNATCERVPDRISPDYPITMGLSPQKDYTGMWLQDWEVISRFHDFVKMWSRQLRRVFPPGRNGHGAVGTSAELDADAETSTLDPEQQGE